MSIQNRNTIIGFLALVVLIGGIWLMQANGKTESTTHTYHAIFRTVEGVKIGAPVYVYGVQVGQVADMALSNGQVQVHIDVDKDIQIPIDSSLEIQTEGLFVEKSMVILMGFEADVLKDNTAFMYAGNAVNVLGLLNQQIDRNIEKREAEKNGS